MLIATYYQELIDKALLSIQHGEPISFVGMYDCGKNYVFSLLVEQLEKNPIDITPIVLDIQDSDFSNVVNALYLEVFLIAPLKEKPSDLNEVVSILKQIGQKQKIVFIINIGYQIPVENSFFSLLSQLRNLLGWNFNTLFFANTGFLFQTNISSKLFDKVFKKNICPILPLNTEDSELILHKYEIRYQKKVDQFVKEKIIRLSGGNPGFIKGLYLQAIDEKEWKKPNIIDDRLFFRIHRLMRELPKEYQDSLYQASISANIPLISNFLSTYGYLINKKTFSSLLALYLKEKKTTETNIFFQEDLEDILQTKLTHAEQRIFECLRKTPNRIINRDMLAKALWKEAWADRYSDWAIDQCVHELRRKLFAIKIAGSIQTKKGEGYIYLPNKSV